MFKRINIIICFLLSLPIVQLSAQDNFTIFIPDYIQTNKNFEVSIITSNINPEAERLEIFFLPDFSLSINKIEVLSQGRRLSIPIHTEFINKYSDQFQKISINLTDTSYFSDGSFFQIVVNLRSSQSTKNNLIFFGEFHSGEKLLENLINADVKDNSERDYPYTVEFNYFQNSSDAGKSLSLSAESYFNVPIDYNFEKKLVVEFWMKIKNPASSFLEIINWETNRPEYKLALNENQMLVFYSSINGLMLSKPFFISQNAWYYFNISFEKEKSELTFMCEGIELARFQVPASIDFENLLLHFQNKNQNSEINIDQFRIINLNNARSNYYRNKNYLDYSDDQSNLILQINFNDGELNALLNNKTISFEDIKLINSDAPIFLKSPELTVKLTDNFYQIEWEGGSFKDAFQYSVEKSNGNNEYVEVGRVDAYNVENKKYFLINEKTEESGIVYFRVKQINKDGSLLYSEVVKVGQGIVEDLIVGQNFPNPFNPTTLIKFELIYDSEVEVKIYNLTGKEVATLHKGYLNKGFHQFEFDASGLPSGVYLYQITTAMTSQTRKMILTK